jgi:prophage regulatory protein
MRKPAEQQSPYGPSERRSPKDLSVVPAKKDPKAEEWGVRGPPDIFLRDREVTRVTGIPRSTRYELIGRGEFPRPVKLSERIVAWSAAEIEDWQRRRIALRDGVGAA